MKNCHTCKHLEWVDSDCFTGFGSGFTCNKRIEGPDDDWLLIKLENEKYLSRYKRCFEAKND